MFGLSIMKTYVLILFWKKNDTVLTFNIVHFLNFEMSVSLQLVPPSNKHRTLEFQNLISAGGVY